MTELVRCTWADSDPLMQAYHDGEWGVPVHDDRHLFEMLTLEGAQAGLSWSTILRRRAGYRTAFEDFQIPEVARFESKDVDRLLADADIIRNRQKIASTIGNARAILEVQREHGSFDRYLWSFVPNGEPIVRPRTALADLPAETDESRALSKALKKRGFAFVGPTICYAFMQTVGMANDHMASCFRARA
jgi:DNA-3-methyladenine glycosylase I